MKNRRRVLNNGSDKIGYHGVAIYPSLVNSTNSYNATTFDILYLDENTLSWKRGAYLPNITTYCYNGFCHITTDLDKNMYITYINNSFGFSETYITTLHIDMSTTDIFDPNINLMDVSQVIDSRIAGGDAAHVVSVVNSNYLWINYSVYDYDNYDNYSSFLIIDLTNNQAVTHSSFSQVVHYTDLPFQLYSTNEGVYGVHTYYLYDGYPYYCVLVYKFKNPYLQYDTIVSRYTYDTIQPYLPMMVGNKIYMAVEDTNEREGYLYRFNNALSSTSTYNWIYYTQYATDFAGNTQFTSSMLMNNPQYTDLSKPNDLAFLFGTSNENYPIYKYGSSGKLNKITVSDPTGTNTGSINNKVFGQQGMIKIREDLWVGKYNIGYSSPYAFVTKDEGQSILLVDSISCINKASIAQRCVSYFPNIIVV